MGWGAYTVRAEHHTAGTGQYDRDFGTVRIIDGAGRTIRLIAVTQVTDIRREPLTGGTIPDLWVETADGGNHTKPDYYAFRQKDGVSNILSVREEAYITPHNLARSGKTELVISTEVSDADSGQEGRGQYLTQVFEWNGQRFTVATKKFPAMTKAHEAECKAEMLACEKQERGFSTGDRNFLSYQEIEAIIGYLGNGLIIGDTGTKAWCEAHPFPAVNQWIQTHADAFRKQLTASAADLPTSQKTRLGDEELLHAKN